MPGLFKDSGILKVEELTKKLNSLCRIEHDKTFIDGNIAYLPNEGRGIFVGDLHGDLEAVVSIIKQTGFLDDMKNGRKTFMTFLGDYSDWGRKIPETINEVITLKLNFPQNVILLRGNHEQDDVAERYGTYNDFLRTYGSNEG